MKKSKIIVPALGILLLSTAASISGTVAWFTASRTFATTVSEFGVGSIDGELKAEVAGVIGTKQKGTSSVADKATILFQNSSGVESILTDASYDSSAQLVYTDNALVTEDAAQGGIGFNESSFHLVGDTNPGTRTDANLKAGTKDSKNYYFAVEWTVTLTYEGSATNDNIHICFDSLNSSITASGGTNNAVGNGIRFNFEVDGESELNYAPLRAEDGVKNVISTSAVDATEDLIASDTKVAAANKLADNVATATAANHAEYLGTIDPSADETLVVTVTCWLEGSDADVLSTNLDAAMRIAGDLKFYCRTSAD